eukprot:TRINITY_DN10943_c0_g1_i2.p1 TRINITY_DN10943_c0_g1~~TRINITY_DN10943_c0_g1_i2.p1  ORF type:complete len:527 (+),score=90.49 TRINITY_DN10943_c0_g1_i2:95-1675(+)
MSPKIALSLLVALGAATLARASSPNYLVIIVDDLGYGDLGCFGRENISTPNVDSLAQDGIKLTQWISAASVCTPSRAAFQTGRLPVRFGMTANALPWRVLALPSQPTGFPAEETTIAELLQTAGYTTAISGKWHLGISNATHQWAHLPRQHGYDSFLGMPFTNMHACTQGTAEAVQYCMIMANNTVVEQPTNYDNLTQIITDHTIDVMQHAVAIEQPFFAVMSFVHVHTPLFTSPRFRNVSKGGRFGDNAEEMDHAVGRLLEALERLQIADDTLVLLFSDNGPFAEEGWDNAGRTGGLKGSKGQTYEGGIRMPALARWPGHIPAGTTSDIPVSTMDVFPTLATLANITVPSSIQLDGRDISQVLMHPSTANAPHQYLWHYCGQNVTAARNGRYKLHFATPIWTSVARPSGLCKECCPYGPTAFNGTGGSLCDCAAGDLQQHDPPVIYDMTNDKEELHPLTPSDIPNYQQLVDETQQALQAHYATVQHHANEMISLPNPALVPCCQGSWPHAEECRCQRYREHHVYP